MRKQTKLVAVLSAAALLAIGASMTSFAATGWAEENGTWVYYDRDGSRVSDEWKKSGSNWFYLDSDGYMATDVLIEDDSNFFYVGADGAMTTNQWVAVENEDAGDDDEPENYWYYFQANGKAYKAGNNTSASFKPINGKKYAFDDDGRMQYGWVNENGERQTGDEDWQDGVYYCGDENDGAQAIGWKEIHILDENWDPDSEVNGDLFDEDQDRWFYFKSNGKRYQDEEKTINGRKYRFDNYGRMIAEWFTKGTASTAVGTLSNAGASQTTGDEIGTVTEGNQGNKEYTTEWRYYGSPEDGARVTKGWFQVTPSEYLHKKEYDDSNDFWYYSDGDGKLVASEFKTINGKKYGFDSYGRMLSGLKLIELDSTSKNKIEEIFDKDNYDEEDNFVDFYAELVEGNYGEVYSYYFGEKTDGAMKTGKQTITLDGEDLSFEFEKSGSKKGRGKVGEDDKKFYIAGKLAKADKDEKYEVVVEFTDGTATQFEGVELLEKLGIASASPEDNGDTIYFEKTSSQNFLALLNDTSNGLAKPVSKYRVINTSGSVIKSKTKCKNGDDLIFVVSGNDITKIYEED